MKDIIKNVLSRHIGRQINLDSESARDSLAVEITAVLESKSLSTDEPLSQEYLDKWTCDLCGKNTHEVDYDYLGNGTNHLECELKEEVKNVPNDFKLGGKLRETINKIIPDTIFGKGFVDNNKYDEVLPGEQLEIWPDMTSWIYESPDGKTIYKRKNGEDYKSRRIVKDWELEKLNIQRKFKK